MMSRSVSHHKATYADMVYSLLPHDLQQKVFDNVFNDYNKDKDNFMDILIVKQHLIRLENEYNYNIETEREILLTNLKKVLLNNTSFNSNFYEYFEEYLTSIIDDAENETDITDLFYSMMRGNRNYFLQLVKNLLWSEKKETKEEVLNDFNGLKDVIFSNEVSYDNPKFKQFLETGWYDDTIIEYNYHLKILEEPDEYSVKKLNHSLEEMTIRLEQLSYTLIEKEFRTLYELITTG